MQVGGEFAKFSHDFKMELQKTQGRKYSDPEVTDIIANFNIFAFGAASILRMCVLRRNQTR